MFGCRARQKLLPWPLSWDMQMIKNIMNSCLHNLQVTLLVPWLAISEQGIVYPDGLEFGNPDEQADWVRAWVEKRTSFPCKFVIKFYPGMSLSSTLAVAMSQSPPQAICCKTSPDLSISFLQVDMMHPS